VLVFYSMFVKYLLKTAFFDNGHPGLENIDKFTLKNILPSPSFLWMWLKFFSIFLKIFFKYLNIIRLLNYLFIKGAEHNPSIWAGLGRVGLTNSPTNLFFFFFGLELDQAQPSRLRWNRSSLAGLGRLTAQ
jgi:hypothetical protein